MFSFINKARQHAAATASQIRPPSLRSVSIDAFTSPVIGWVPEDCYTIPTEAAISISIHELPLASILTGSHPIRSIDLARFTESPPPEEWRLLRDLQPADQSVIPPTDSLFSEFRLLTALPSEEGTVGVLQLLSIPCGTTRTSFRTFGRIPPPSSDYAVPLDQSMDVSQDLLVLLLDPAAVTGQHYLFPDAQPPKVRHPLPTKKDPPTPAPKPTRSQFLMARVAGHSISSSKPPKRQAPSPQPAPANWRLLLPVLQPPIDLSLGLNIGLASPLYPYQAKGIEFLADSQAALLGDDMGTGKTVQTSVALRVLLQQGKLRTALILCPLSVIPSWQRELSKWADNLKVTLVRGSKQQRHQKWDDPAHVWLTTYETLRNDLTDVLRLRKGKFDLIVIDEAQRVKNWSSKITCAIRDLKATYRWGLSGTPLENNIDELWNILNVLDPNISQKDPDWSTGLQNMLRPMFLRRRKEDVLQDLPELVNRPVWLALQDCQRESYDTLEEQGVLELNSKRTSITAHSIIVLLNRLKQICNRCPRSGESSKLDWLNDSLQDISSQGDKALIFTQFAEEDTAGAQWLSRMLAGFNPLYYGDANTDSKRAVLLAAFEKNPAHKVFIGHPKSAGVGLNELVVANYVIHFDHWWNPATTNQATARAHRPGQTKKVIAYDLWIEDTYEEVIFQLLQEKQALYNDIIDSLSARKEPEESLAFEVANRLFEKYGLRPL